VAGNALPGAEAFSPGGLTSLTASFMFKPPFGELSTSAAVPALVERRLHAQVRLSSGGVQGSWVDLPDVVVMLMPLLIPKVAAFFRHGGYAATYNDTSGFVLVVVPTNSPIGNVSGLTSILNSLEATLAPLSAFASLAGLATGVGALASAVAAQSHAKLRRVNSISNLNDITMISGTFNDTEAEDEFSSIIFVAPQGQDIQCFVKRDFNTKDGAFTITTGNAQHALVPYLSSSNPASQPPGLVHVDASSSTFADKLSSLKFV
jgi:hypothetical protein